MTVSRTLLLTPVAVVVFTVLVLPIGWLLKTYLILVWLLAAFSAFMVLFSMSRGNESTSFKILLQNWWWTLLEFEHSYQEPKKFWPRLLTRLRTKTIFTEDCLRGEIARLGSDELSNKRVWPLVASELPARVPIGHHDKNVLESADKLFSAFARSSCATPVMIHDMMTSAEMYRDRKYFSADPKTPLSVEEAFPQTSKLLLDKLEHEPLTLRDLAEFCWDEPVDESTFKGQIEKVLNLNPAPLLGVVRAWKRCNVSYAFYSQVQYHHGLKRIEKEILKLTGDQKEIFDTLIKESELPNSLTFDLLKYFFKDFKLRRNLIEETLKIVQMAKAF